MCRSQRFADLGICYVMSDQANAEKEPKNGTLGVFRKFMVFRHSLRVQLLGFVLLTLLITLCLNLYVSFRSASAAADLVSDQMLTASARVIAEAVRMDEAGTLNGDIPPAALEMFDTGYGDQVFYRVMTPWGNLIAGYPDLPIPEVTRSGEEIFFRGRPMRAVVLSHPVVGLEADGVISVVVAVTLNSHTAIRRNLWFSDFTNQLILVVVAGAALVLALRWGLGPVLRLRDEVRARGRENLAPLSPAMVQLELRPLVLALNDYMERVQNQMAAQRRFVANAAHQLRTPLALIATQASVAAREARPEGRNEALAAIQKSTRQVTRLAGQLLTLSRAEPGSRRPRSEAVDLSATARRVLENLAETALRREIDLGLEAERPVYVTGDGTMLGEMVVNLVDNALTYTPAGGAVTVCVRQIGSSAILTVEDNGPGIPDHERQQVFERFYRVMGTQGEGSGLGLAIVREVVDAADGKVILDHSPSGGLFVTITFPVASGKG